LTTHQLTHGIPAEQALQELMDSFLNYLERRERQESAIPGKDAALSQEAGAVAALHCTQDSTGNGEIKKWT